MSVYRRGSRWYAYVTIGGQRVRRSAGSRADAIRIEADIRRAVVRTPDRGLEECLARYLTTEASRLRSYRDLVSHGRAIDPWIRGRLITDAPQAVADMVRGCPGHSIATLNRRIALIRRLCSLAYLWGWVSEPVAVKVKALPGEVARHVYLTAPQVERLALACRHAGSAAFVLLAAYTGLRRGELLALGPGDYLDGCLVVRTSKTGRPRMVPVVDKIRDIATALPLPVTDAILRKRFEAARDAIGMPGLRVHDLRHTCASLLVQAGIPLRTVGEILGHTSASTTLRYAHLSPTHLTAAMQQAFDAPQPAPQVGTDSRK